MKNIYLLVIALFCLGSGTTTAQYTKLLDFAGATNGSAPNGSLFYDGTYLYGTTETGGMHNSGTLFKIKPDSTGYEKLLDFSLIKNGANPWCAPVYDGTFLYGTAHTGGIHNTGTIFKIKPDSTGFSKLLDFADTATGDYPLVDIIYDGTYLYGMTSGGDTDNYGLVYKIKPNGTGYTKLVDFKGASNGMGPVGCVFSDGTYVYGMTRNGGVTNQGVIFKVKNDGTGFLKLLDFADTATGRNPDGTFISDGTYLYATTSQGGKNGMGAIFKIMPDGSNFTKIFDFAGVTSGSSPLGSLAYNGSFLYGITYLGGTSNFGVLFKLKTDGTGFSKLADFDGPTYGKYPYGGSLVCIGNSVYGMTCQGGKNNMGVIFKYQDTTLLTGVIETSKENGLTIYPNPFKVTTTLKTATNMENAVIVIYNVLGERVETIKNISGREIQLKRNNLPQGLYFISIAQNNKLITTSKLIITN